MTEIVQKTADEIVDFVVEWFLSHPRNMVHGTPMYVDGRGGRCAFAILCREGTEVDTKLASLDERQAYAFSSAVKMDHVDWMELIKPEFRGQSEEFYQGIQDLHDKDDFWIEMSPSSDYRSLSVEGGMQVSKIRAEGREVG